MKKNESRLGVVLPFLSMMLMASPVWSSMQPVDEPVEIAGIVYACDHRGSGIQIDTGDAIVIIFGKGPVWYWQEQGVELPIVGDAVIVSAYSITFSDGTVKWVADHVDLGADGTIDIDLRDEAGRPLWRQLGIPNSQARARHGQGDHWQD